MRRRRVLALVAVALLIGASGVTWTVFWPRPHIAAERYELIQQGMTLAEVSALLGGPPGDYRTEDVGPRYPFSYPPGCPLWQGNEGAIVLKMGDDGRVASASYFG